MTNQKTPEIKICTDCYIVCESIKKSCPECGGLSFDESPDYFGCSDGGDCSDCGCCDGGETDG